MLSTTVSGVSSGPVASFFAVTSRDEHRLQRHIAGIDVGQTRRIANLRGKVATIKLAAQTQTAYSEAKDRLDDSLGSCRAALRDGVLAGGGCSLAKASKLVPRGILRTALVAPLSRIAANAGHSADLIVEKVLAADPRLGFDAVTNKLVDLMDAGILDATAVTLAALNNAVSAAGLLLTTQATVIEVTDTP